MIAICFTFCSRVQRRSLAWLGTLLLAGALPLSATASVTANLNWTASPDTNVTGYTIYYGLASHQYANSVPVGNLTTTVVPSLLENTTYFFAAKAHDDAGDKSDFSNEAAFAGFNATPDAFLRLRSLPSNFTGNPLNFSLDASAPAGASINPTNGIVCWTPGRANASTTTYINVIVTDTVNPALSLMETLQVVVSDYLEVRVGSTAVAAGQSGSLPLTVASSGTVTNVQLTLAWPGTSLVNPTLTFAPPVIAGSVQNLNNQLVIQLQTDPSQPLTGTNLAAQLNFQAVSGQSTAILSIPAITAAGSTADGTAYANAVTQAGEVVVVGSDPLLRPHADASLGRTVQLYALPGDYELQSTTSLVPPVTWMPVMTYQQTSVAQTVTLDATAPVIFYRLQQFDNPGF